MRAETTALSGKLTVRHAGSLTPLCAEIHREFKSMHPQVETVDVGGGGVAMARDLALGKECDVYAFVDYSNIANLLIPDFADWYLIFAATGFVLRYTEKSTYAEEINSDNWIEIIQRDDVSFWRSNPEGDPAGYRTLMVLQLAEKYYGLPGLYERMTAKSERFLTAETVGLRDSGYSFPTAPIWARAEGPSSCPTRSTYLLTSAPTITSRPASQFRACGLGARSR